MAALGQGVYICLEEGALTDVPSRLRLEPANYVSMTRNAAQSVEDSRTNMLLICSPLPRLGGREV